MKIGTTFLFLLFLPLLLNALAYADDFESRLKALEDTLKEQQKTIQNQEKTIEELKQELTTLKNTAPAPAAEAKAESQRGSKSSGIFGSSFMSNPNISLILNTYAYASNIKQSELKNWGIPGYSRYGIDRDKGFNLDSAELFLFAPVDPYFNLYATIPATEDNTTVEEAYFVTTALPGGIQVKGGKFRSGFGRINGQHEHAWDFIDIPLIYRAFLGDEGLVEKGAQVTYLPPLPFYLLLGTEALQGDNDVLFGKNAKSGPHAFTGFAKASFDTGDYSSILLGPSVLFGKTKNDSIISENTQLTGSSQLFGFETTYKWKPSKAQSLTLQGEYFYRHQDGHIQNATPIKVNYVEKSLDRAQAGFYLQALYQMGRWRTGLRYDLLDFINSDYILSGKNLDIGPRPWRVTGSLEFNPTEFSRIRLQYNHDRSGIDGRANEEVFLQFILGIGAHAAHPF